MGNQSVEGGKKGKKGGDVYEVDKRLVSHSSVEETKEAGSRGGAKTDPPCSEVGKSTEKDLGEEWLEKGARTSLIGKVFHTESRT